MLGVTSLLSFHLSLIQKVGSDIGKQLISEVFVFQLDLFGDLGIIRVVTLLLFGFVFFLLQLLLESKVNVYFKSQSVVLVVVKAEAIVDQ